MKFLKQKLSNFSNAISTHSHCLRPGKETQIAMVFAHAADSLLARGQGLSYGDCCLNNGKVIIDTTRLNHFRAFDINSGIAIAEGGVSFIDLLTLSPYYIPPVIPGTLYATLAGGIANDVHGKNNHAWGSLGQHILWIDLELKNQTFHCSPTENRELFYATIGGLGLTGIIKCVAIQLRKASHGVCCKTEKYYHLEPLLQRMQEEGLQHDYQVAWIDLLNKKTCALLSLASHVDIARNNPNYRFPIPPLPCRTIYAWNMRLFNYYYSSFFQTQKIQKSLITFNNPLDKFRNWNRLYGKKGLLQFQAVFASDNALAALQQIMIIIKKSQATPTLAVLKYFTQTGLGLLSFTQPGFSLAIDFINNKDSQKAIHSLNAYITEINGKIYLAKDLLLTKQQFNQQYPNYQKLIELLGHYQSPMSSNLSRRLGITYD